MSTKNKKLAIYIIFAIVICGIGFWGGVIYKSKNCSFGDFQQFGNMQGREFGVNGNKMMFSGNGSFGGMQQKGALISGEIISKDDRSVTVKLRDGGSKLVFFSTSTIFTKFVTGTNNDLSLGDEIVANGNTNQDGSVTAQNIQIKMKF